MKRARIAVALVLLALAGACGKAASPTQDSGLTAGTGAGVGTATAGDGANATFDAGDTQPAHDAAIREHDAAEPTADAGSSADAALPELRLPPDDGAFDYQLGGSYATAAGVVTVSRDRTDSPAAGLYNICYINGFQVQPGEESSWDADLILRDGGGDPIVDPDWDEQLLDVSSADKRQRIAQKLTGFMSGCATKGFDAIEIDNLDTYSRSGGRISKDDAVALMALLSTQAHGLGLAIAQKNSTELLDRRADMGTDFAVAEECSRYDECGDYVAAYGTHVLMIEYRDADFTNGCAAYGSTHAIVRRDVDLVTQGSAGYVYDGC